MASGVRGVEEVLAALGQYASNYDRAIVDASALTARQLENHMVANAKWTDQTSNARNGLTGSWSYDGSKATLRASGSMTYQVFLELGFGRKYEIIWPSLVIFAPRWHRNVERFVKGYTGA